MKYLILYITETDGEIAFKFLERDELLEFVKTMTDYDYCIVEGKLIKDFCKKLNPKALK